MPARLYFSNSLEALADRLIAGMDGADPFDSPVIATPTPALRGWLQSRIAEKQGIAVNLDFQLLESLLWKRLADLDRFRDVEERQPARLLDATSFQGLILDRLRKNPSAALRAYLIDPSFEPEPYDEARRLCQLAGRLAALFREYEYSRVTEGGFKGLTECWMRGEACFEQYLSRLPKRDERHAKVSELREYEAWQREIYQALFRAEEGLRDRWGKATGVYRYTLPQYAEMVLSQPRSDASPALGRLGDAAEAKVYHLFGISQVSPFHRELIRRLADEEILKTTASRFEIYALNPCAEYWEDALTPREGRAAGASIRTPPRTRLTESELQAEELPFEAGENALLNRFGKPGRETVKLWNQVTDYDFSGYFHEPESNTVLAAVQRALLRRSGGEKVRRLPQDRSLQIWSAPDLYAEVEGVKAHLAERLLEDPALRLEDIAVIPADFETYLPVLEAVFGGDEKKAGHVPFCLPEAGMLNESVLLRGFRALLELGSGAFNLRALLGFLKNPAAQKKMRLDSNAVEAMGEFLERTGFQEGWDAEHLKGQGAAPGSRSTWEEAEQRGLLGLIMDSPEPSQPESDFHPAVDAAVSMDREDLSSCLKLLEDLRRDLLPFRSGENLSYREWSEVLRGLLVDYFQVDTKEGLETNARSGLQRFFTELEQWSAWESESEQGVSHPVITTLLEDHFREPKATRMPFLAGGVRIGSLNALRGLPFRRVYVLGLNAGKFPAPREAAPLDLRSYRRVLGETDPATRDLYALLEIISATSEGLVLSYLRRDKARDSALQPSYALTGLISYLEFDILNSPFALLKLDSEGRHASAGDFCDASPPPTLESSRMKTLANLSMPAAVALASMKGQPPQLPHARTKPMADSNVVSLRDLVEYLRNPAGHAVFRHFRLDNGLQGEEEHEAAPLFLDKWQSQDFLNAALRAELLKGGTGEDFSRDGWRQTFLAGKTPPPPYANLERERLEKETRELIGDAVQSLRPFLLDSGLRFQGTLRLGRQGGPLEPPILSLPAFDTTALDIPLHIEGDLPFFFRGRKPDESESGWALLLNEGEYSQVTLYVLQLCATALGLDDFWRGPAHVFVVGDGEISISRLPELEKGLARKNLRHLLSAYSQLPDFDHLPLKHVEKILKSDPVKFAEIEDWPEALAQKEREDAESGFGFSSSKAKILRAIHPEVPADAAMKIEQRLLPFLRWQRSWEKLEKVEEVEA